MKITLIAGHAHLKHTEGGDFRQATYRALRQGLKKAQSILLEPFYNFKLEIPSETVGRAMSDISRMCGNFLSPEIDGEMSILNGYAPVSAMRGYQMEVTSYTRGKGRLFCTLRGYEPCHNAEEVIQAIGYDSERDPGNPTGSVFCAHGVGFLVEWDKVEDYMHLESGWKFLRKSESMPEQKAERIAEGKPEKIEERKPEKITERKPESVDNRISEITEEFIENKIQETDKEFEENEIPKTAKEFATGEIPKTTNEMRLSKNKPFPGRSVTGGKDTDRKNTGLSGSWQEDKELEAIFVRTFGPIKQKQSYSPSGLGYEKNSTGKDVRIKQKDVIRERKPVKEYLLVDGYNIIFSWEELKELAKENLDAARNKLMDILCNYQGFQKCILILVFDAYKVKGGTGEISDYHNIHVVYTKEAETADEYIEKVTHEIAREHRVTVATSDALEQVIIMGQGAARLSANDLKEEITRVRDQIRRDYLDKQLPGRIYLGEQLNENWIEILEDENKDNK
jgi:Predicted RNA-binding protein containing a PIN domain